MELPKVEVLKPEEIDNIHSTALRILEEIGFKTDSQDVAELMRKAGVVEKEGAIRIPHKLVDRALNLTPKTIQLYTPSGSPWRMIGDGNSIIMSGHQAVFVLDYGAADPRPGRKEDNVNFTRLANSIEEIDGIGVQVYPQDVPRPSAIIHAIESMLTYSDKPLFFAPEHPEALETICNLARVASGSDNLGSRPFLIAQPSPISPLFWVKESALCVIGAAKQEVPCAVLPQIIPGVSGPVTLAGTLALHHAESLLGIVVAQLVKPGAPLIYPGAWVTFDMSGGGIDIGAPEMHILSLATPQLARYLGLPCMTNGPDTNAHILDIQNGVEKSLSAAFDIMSGTDVVVNTGMFSNALTVSLEQVLIDAEIVSMIRKIRCGIELNEKTIAFEVIKRVGIKGDFLTDPHTLTHFKKELWDTRNRLFQRMKFDKWRESGAALVVDLAHKRVEEILSQKPHPLPGSDQLSQMVKIVAEFDRKYGDKKT